MLQLLFVLISPHNYRSVQDNVSIHVDLDLPCYIGTNISIGHNAILHSCCININDNVIIGVDSLITKKLPYKEGFLIMGSPAQIV